MHTDIDIAVADVGELPEDLFSPELVDDELLWKV